MTSASLIRTALLCAALFAPSLLLAKKAPRSANALDDYGSVVALSPYEVTAESMEFKDWLRLTSPHFVVYTDAEAKDAALLVQHLEMLHQAAQFFLRRQSLKLPPTIILLPTERSDWKKIGSKGSVEWQVAATMLGSSRTALLVQHDWQSEGLTAVWAMIGLHTVRSMNLRGGLWFDIGISHFFSTVEFDRDTLTIGKQSRTAYTLKKSGWLDWPTFFGLTYKSSDLTKDGTKHQRFGEQAGAFTHFLLTNSDPASASRLLRWAAYLDAGNEPTEQSFKEVFQHDWQSWQHQIDQLFCGGKYTIGTIKFPDEALAFPVTSARPSAREMKELFVLSQILNQQTKDSERSLDALLARGLKTESLRELLADACSSKNRRDAQLKELRTIIAAGSTNPNIYANAARSLYSEKLARTIPSARLGEEANEIRVWCQQARQLEPLHYAASETLAWTEALSPTVEKRSLEAITGICRTLEGHAPTDEALAALAIARWRIGNVKQARSLAEHVRSSAFCGKEAKEIMRMLLAEIDGTSSESPSTSAPPATAAP